MVPTVVYVHISCNVSRDLKGPIILGYVRSFKINDRWLEVSVQLLFVLPLPELEIGPTVIKTTSKAKGG